MFECGRVTGLTPRAERVVLRGGSREGETVEGEADGLLARALQNDMDNLVGMLFFDRRGGVGRDLMKRKYKRAQRRHQRH
jgi:peptide deformylase